MPLKRYAGAVPAAAVAEKKAALRRIYTAEKCSNLMILNYTWSVIQWGSLQVESNGTERVPFLC
jgi:hypothetical protein